MATYSQNEPFPAALPVREALEAYLAENAFTTEEYDAETVRLSFWGVRFTLPNPASRQLAVRFHDLHHVMTGVRDRPGGRVRSLGLGDAPWDWRLRQLRPLDHRLRDVGGLSPLPPANRGRVAAGTLDAAASRAEP